MLDVWRKNNPHKKLFTYHIADKTIHSRIDRTYITRKLTTKTCKINPTSTSDHDSVAVIIQVKKRHQKVQDVGNWTNLFKTSNLQRDIYRVGEIGKKKENTKAQ